VRILNNNNKKRWGCSWWFFRWSWTAGASPLGLSPLWRGKGGASPEALALIKLLGAPCQEGPSGLTPDERTIFAYATAASSSIACSYSYGLT
jgi:hypothetical protein